MNSIFSTRIIKVTGSMFILFLVVTTLSAVSANDIKEEIRDFHAQAYMDAHKISVQLQNILVGLSEGKHIEIEGEYVFSENVLPEFYANRDYMPAWKDYDALLEAVEILENAYVDGLNPEDYHGHVLSEIVEKIEEQVNKPDFDHGWVAEFDILVTDALLLYAYHIIKGKVHPETLNPNWNYDFREISPDAPYILEKAIEQGTIAETLDRFRPKTIGYTEYVELLAEYRKIAEGGGWKPIADGGAIKPGEEDSRIPLIRKRLQVSGELSSLDGMESTVYDDALLEDIKRFQERNALHPDGVIGKGTFAELNMSIEERIDKIRINMERTRWIVGNMTDNYIIVNIAAFKAYYVVDHEIVFATNVQVGQTYTQTPIFKGRLRYIEFNPTWTVPVSIIHKSMFAKMQEDPTYLDTHHFELLDASGNIIPTSSVDFSKYTSHTFPYSVRQKPGTDNALGEVKFIFPNPHSVYLHDTPSKSNFEKEERTFSHGCIRTQNPLDLAEIILQGSEWTREKIDATIETRQTTRAFPDEDIDVLLLYWTAGYYEGDGVGFFRDVYDRDAVLLSALNREDHRVVSARQQ